MGRYLTNDGKARQGKAGKAIEATTLLDLASKQETRRPVLLLVVSDDVSHVSLNQS
jgi:hypothetical protein